MKRVTSRENPEYRQLVRLVRSAVARRESRQIVLDGAHLVQAYLSAFGGEGVRLFVSESAADRAEIRALCEALIGTTCLPDPLFDGVSPVESPTGVLAVAPLSGAKCEQLADNSLLVLIDGLQDPGNLGSILRSAAAAGAAAAWVSASSADPWSPKSLRGGMGAQFRLPIRDRVELKTALAGMPFRIVTTDAASGESLYHADLSGPIAIVIGAEGRGVSPELVDIGHTRIRIPMRAGVESLNAAAAAAVLFFEWRRRHAG